jgi:tRNA-specific 2-thiouridylase
MTKVFVGMSGGVDSSLSAALLVEAGYDVTGVYMKNWTQDLPGMKCPWAEDLADAKRVAVQLGIPFKVFDFQKEYKHLVVDYMISEYSAGRTPNPDVMCNQEVKFGLFLAAALADGADMIATGHYARTARFPDDFPSRTIPSRPSLRGSVIAAEVVTSEPAQRNARQRSLVSSSLQTPSSSLRAKRGNPEINRIDCHDDKSSRNDRAQLLRAKDANKDQTYFLYRVTESALEKTIFPIGDLTSKTEVRKEAERRGLITARRKDSQGICFVGSVGIRDFLSQFVETKPGDIIEKDTGKVIGQHDGAIFYTFGQRHGLSVGGGLPFYVVGKNMAKNEVYVSTNLNVSEFWCDEIELEDIHWINDAPKPGKEYQIRVRHRAPLKPAILISTVLAENDSQSVNRNIRTVLIKKSVKIKLNEPERAIAPGQSIVIYDGEICLGGGIVAR